MNPIIVKTISELPIHTRETLRQKFGSKYDKHLHLDGLVEIAPDGDIELVDGTLADLILDDVNGGEPVVDIFQR